MSGPSWRPSPAEVPSAPGCYRFLTAAGEVLYVGKAKNLRNRLGSYFVSAERLAPRTRLMVSMADRVDWVQVASDADALQLEWTLIHRHRPRFNIRLQDDRRYPELSLSGEAVPRLSVVRSRRRRGERRFGPFRSTREARTIVDAVLPVFPVRSCDQATFQRAQRTDRACLLAELGRCSAPCVGRIGVAEHAQLVQGLAGFLAGRTDTTLAALEAAMAAAAEDRNYELAARLRDQLEALRTALVPLEVVWPSTESAVAVAVAVAVDGERAAAAVLDVHEGRLAGRHLWLFDLSNALPAPDDAAGGPADDAAADQGGGDQGDADQGDGAQVAQDRVVRELVVRALARRFADPGEVVPALLVLPTRVPDELVTLLRARRSGPVRAVVPVRGRRRTLLDTAGANARSALAADALRRDRLLVERQRVLCDLAGALALSVPPRRIECFDISHFGGTGTVASMVVFVDGVPDRSRYRSFTISAEQNNDVASMYEAVSRRLGRLADGDAAFVPAPDLIVIDGGMPQLDAAVRAARDSGFAELAVVALAKREEQLWVPGASAPVPLDPESGPMLLVRHLRDEAHRSALRHQRRRRTPAGQPRTGEAADRGGTQR
jgi:excinuclease ABC subunit C